VVEIETTIPGGALTLDRFIVLYLLVKNNGAWGYKDIDESMGPVEVNCPLSFLDGLSPATGFATKWRERVKKYHASRVIPPLHPGCVVLLRKGLRPQGPHTLVKKVGRTWHTTSYLQIRPTHLAGLTIIYSNENTKKETTP
jgi:hypothetical protein